MPHKVFISYRRGDAAGHAGRVSDRLSDELGQDALFMDVDGIPLGSDFVKVLREEVGRCQVLLALIGGAWLDARDAQGKWRLDDPNDLARCPAPSRRFETALEAAKDDERRFFRDRARPGLKRHRGHRRRAADRPA